MLAKRKSGKPILNRDIYHKQGYIDISHTTFKAKLISIFLQTNLKNLKHDSHIKKVINQTYIHEFVFPCLSNRKCVR